MALRLLIRLLIFSFPCFLANLLILGTAIYSGEAMPIQMVVAEQIRNNPLIYGSRNARNILPYKTQMIKAKKPEVLVLGSSRMLQFRSEFMNKKPDAFYNASGPGWTLTEAIYILESLGASYKPEIIIIGIDQPWFSANYTPDEIPAQADESLSYIVNAAQNLAKDLLRGSLPLQRLIERADPVYGNHALGLRAFSISFGYRNDGSLQQGMLIANQDMQAAARAESIRNFKDGVMIPAFTTGTETTHSAFEKLEYFLKIAKERGSAIIGVTPPYLPSIYEEMLTREDYLYIQKALPRIETIFKENDARYFDFSDAAAIGGSDEELYDGWHSTELLTLRMYIEIVKAEPDLMGEYSDPDFLQSLIEQTRNPMDVFRSLHPDDNHSRSA